MEEIRSERVPVDRVPPVGRRNPNPGTVVSPGRRYGLRTDVDDLFRGVLGIS